MTLWQTSKVVWSNILRNRMRTFLTMLGMIIGVAAVIILVSLVQSFYDSMLDSYADMGFYNVSVSIIGRNGNMIIDDNDMYQYAEDHKDTIKGVMPIVNLSRIITKNGDKSEYTTVKGVDENYISLVNKEVEIGHNITYSDISTRQKVCVIGSYLNQKFFHGNAKIGDTLRLDGEEFTVIGVTKASSDSSEWSSDNSCYMPYTTAMRITGLSSVSSYDFYIKDKNRVAVETAEMKKYLFNIFHNEKSYSVTNMIDTLKQINQEMSVLTTMIAGIAGISLVVAGVGIMNIMLVSVSERTREIGIRKALGAKYRDIMRQFILEATTTSMLGGVLGILTGAFATVQLGKLFKIVAVPSTSSIITSFGVSVFIGILFGLLPARKAARLNPIEALRSE